VERPRSADASEPDVALVLGCYAAFARGDIEEAVAPMHPEVEWIEPDEFADGGRRRGPAAVAEYLAASRASWEQLSSEPTAYRRGEQIVIVHHLHGRLLDGTRQEATVADVFTVRDGAVVHMRAYADPDEAFAGS
jgi:ketosteroid isomerase-like protein